MTHDKNLIKLIALEVEEEYKMGGLSDGLYFDYTSDVAMRYFDEREKQRRLICSCGNTLSINGKRFACSSCMKEWTLC